MFLDFTFSNHRRPCLASVFPKPFRRWTNCSLKCPACNRYRQSSRSGNHRIGTFGTLQQPSSVEADRRRQGQLAYNCLVILLPWGRSTTNASYIPLINPLDLQGVLETSQQLDGSGFVSKRLITHIRLYDRSDLITGASLSFLLGAPGRH